MVKTEQSLSMGYVIINVMTTGRIDYYTCIDASYLWSSDPSKAMVYPTRIMVFNEMDSEYFQQFMQTTGTSMHTIQMYPIELLNKRQHNMYEINPTTPRTRYLIKILKLFFEFLQDSSILTAHHLTVGSFERDRRNIITSRECATYLRLAVKIIFHHKELTTALTKRQCLERLLGSFSDKDWSHLKDEEINYDVIYRSQGMVWSLILYLDKSRQKSSIDITSDVREIAEKLYDEFDSDRKLTPIIREQELDTDLVDKLKHYCKQYEMPAVLHYIIPSFLHRLSLGDSFEKAKNTAIIMHCTDAALANENIVKYLRFIAVTLGVCSVADHLALEEHFKETESSLNYNKDSTALKTICFREGFVKMHQRKALEVLFYSIERGFFK